MVRMVHPDLPDGQDYDAQPQQVPHLRAAGWQVASGQDEQGEEWPAEAQPLEAQPQVRLRHPVTGGDATVAEQTVPHWRSVGWLVVEDEPEPEAAPVAAQPGEEFTVAQLRELAKERGISPLPTTKAELLEALASNDNQQDQDQAGDEPARREEDEG